MALSNVKRGSAGRWLIAAVAVPTLLLLYALPAHAAVDCPPMSRTLLKVPELVSHDGVLRGTILLHDEQQRILFRTPTQAGTNRPGTPDTHFACNPQYVRVFTGLHAQPPLPPVPADQYADPVPGPTLRARVGDVIELSFINQINPGDFGSSIDLGRCDSSSAGYPGQPHGNNPGHPPSGGGPKTGGDVFPDCFHGSSTGNLHFHGTHVNVSGTGDNVFLGLRPLPRDNRGNLTIKPEEVTKGFADFFKECEKNLGSNVLLEWPKTWKDTPLGPWTTGNPDDPNSPPDTSKWTGRQAQLLSKYEPGLWKVDQGQIKNQWPQYYVGAFPYCFRIPEYTSASWPPSSGPIMGQAPGTHWYHAHEHGSTTIDVANGMTGVFIIEGKYDDDLNAWYGKDWTRRQPVMVINELGVSPNLMRAGPGQQDKGAEFSVNGRLQPVVEMRPGEVQLWRIANTSGRSGAFFLGPPNFNWRQIAQDGVQFADSNYKASQNQPFDMAPGNRVDLLVQAPTMPGIYPILVKHEVDPGDLASAAPVVLMQVRVREGPPVTGNQAQFIPNAPTLPPFLTDITDDEVKTTMNKPREIAFASSQTGGSNNPPSYAQHSINNTQFNDDEMPWTVHLDTTEEWKITNATVGISHPFHIHLNPFQVVEVFNLGDTFTAQNGRSLPRYVVSTQAVTLQPGQCQVNPDDPSTWKACPANNVPGPRIWWDVFPIPSGQNAKTSDGKSVLIPGYFKMRSRFVDYPGWYVMHCHILAHEDRGMMMTVSLEPMGAPAAMHMPFAHH